MEAILYHLEKKHALTLDEIFQRPKELADALEQVFGTGSRIVEDLILRNLYQDLGLVYNYTNDVDSLDFAERLREALKRGKI